MLTGQRNSDDLSYAPPAAWAATILYIGGSILVILAAVLLITKRRMSADE